MKLVTPDDVTPVKKIRLLSESERVCELINSGLLKGKFSFNTSLDKLVCSEEVLNFVASKFEEVGWNVKVIEDNYQTYTIIFSKNS